MNSLYWLLAANVAVWLGIGAYMVFLSRAQSGLEKRLHHMEISNDA